MNRGIEVRQALIESAIRVVAVQGIQNATTKALAADAKVNEVYIYRYFESKDDLLRQTFYALDKELMYVLKNSIQRLRSVQSTQSAFRTVFHDFWQFALEDRAKCSFIIQYYYSSYYMSHADDVRKEIYQPFLDSIAGAFVEEADPWVELNHLYDVVFAKLWRVVRGVLPNDDATEESVYREVVLIEERSLRWLDREKSI